MKAELSWGWLARLGRQSLSLIFPNVCQICREREAGVDESYLCQACRTAPFNLQPVVPPFCERCGLTFEGEVDQPFQCFNCRDQALHFRAARSAVKFSGLAREVIHRYKYTQALWFEPFLAELLIGAVRTAEGENLSKNWDCIVPIPLHWLKRRQRSFNQAERLARRLSRATGLPVQTRWLRRRRLTRSQTTLSRSQRAENVARAFAYRPGSPLDGQRILLVDDVLTTGATASACAGLLLKNGAAQVDVWTVARNTLR